MKKVMISAVAVALVTAASADLAVSWTSASVGIQDNSSAFVVGGTIQLVWSATGNITTAGAYNINLAATRGQSDGAGGFVLNNNVTGDFGLFGPFAEGTANPFTSADVGGADINTGFFFNRVVSDDMSFLDTDVFNAADYVYNPADTATIYSDNIILGAPGTAVNTAANGTTVIPEPATLGLLGIAGLGMFLARRKTRR